MLSISLIKSILEEQRGIAEGVEDWPEAERMAQAIKDLEGIKDYIKMLGGKTQ